MNLSDRPSRVIRGGSGWQPLPISALAGGRTRGGNGRLEAPRAPDVDARIAAAFQEGLAEGRFQADAEVEARERRLGESAGERWSSMLDRFGAGLAEIEEAAADRLLDLAAQLAATIACREIAGARDRIEPVLAQSLALIAGACRQLEVVAHPTDCQRIEAWLRPRCGEASLSIRPDSGIAPGGCLLRADDATLDATVQTRIRRTLAAVGIDDAQAGEWAQAAVADMLPADPDVEDPVQ